MTTTKQSAADLVIFARAADFAARRHVAQRRKGRAAEPYINHPAEVAHLVAEATGGADAVAIVAALLHDTIEDTGATADELERLFGAAVASVVAEVSDDKTLPQAERKRLQVEHAARHSPSARLIKLADKTSNLRSMRTSPPVGWDQARRRAYFVWAKAVVDCLRGTNARLEAWFDEAYATGLQALEEEAPVD